MNRNSLILAILVLLAACFAIGYTWDRQRRLDAQQYAVYSALIRERYASPGIDLIVIADRAVTEMPGGSLAQLNEALLQRLRGLAGIDQGILDDFQARNGQAQALVARFDLPVALELVSPEEIAAILQEGGWDGFYKKYPNSQGAMTLSRVGFNVALDRALVYVGNQSNYLAGAGFFFSLAKVNGVWTIQDELMAWIS